MAARKQPAKKGAKKGTKKAPLQSTKKTVTLTQLFEGYQRTLIENLGVSRELILHPVAKGDATELRWVTMLQSYLPKRYKVEKAFVIDSNGDISEQLDLVVFDRHFSPFIFVHDGISYIPAESVYAVFEIKPEVSKTYLEYAGTKAESVRRLKRTSAPIIHAASGSPAQPKAPPPIIAGFLALDSVWKPPLGLAFEKSFTGLRGDRSLQLGCVARHGAFELAKNGTGGTDLIVSRSETSVMNFVLTLTRFLQTMGSVPAIQVEQYARHL